jgi:hypothetical protein
MALIHYPLFVIYASSALTTMLNLGLILHQHGRFKRMSRQIGFLRRRGDDIRSQLEDIQKRLAVLEEKVSMEEENCKLKIVA